MLTAAEGFGTGQVLWSLIWFFLFFIWIWLLITIFADIFRSDMGGLGKAGWIVLVIVLPFVGVLLYLIINGDEMNDRAAEQAQQNEAAFRNYVQDAAGGSSSADELTKLSSLHDSGKISDDEYAAMKAKVIA